MSGRLGRTRCEVQRNPSDRSYGDSSLNPQTGLSPRKFEGTIQTLRVSAPPRLRVNLPRFGMAQIFEWFTRRRGDAEVRRSLLPLTNRRSVPTSDAGSFSCPGRGGNTLQARSRRRASRARESCTPAKAGAHVSTTMQPANRAPGQARRTNFGHDA